MEDRGTQRHEGGRTEDISKGNGFLRERSCAPLHSCGIPSGRRPCTEYRNVTTFCSNEDCRAGYSIIDRLKLSQNELDMMEHSIEESRKQTIIWTEMPFGGI